eukprot:TRINITY_DN2002_c0_g1_i1.p1 TRINITY_DN2002_c0_g1~~TRINITY_DN2002_c0_g1_i1.p1  ORF type:complete len:302 (+),score=54.64 TRINITY_DN2002_c0_g1_i1:59-964(+)
MSWSGNAPAREVEMSERERQLMSQRNLMTDKDGNLVHRTPVVLPASVQPSSEESRTRPSAIDSNLNRNVTINIGELVELIRQSNGVAPAPATPPSGLGNPGPLGLGGFALTTFTLSVFNTQVIIDPALESVVLPLALFYGGLAQFIAGLFEFRAPNTFGATAFCSYGAFWISFAFYLLVIAEKLGSQAYQATGLFLFVWLIFTCYMFIGSLKVSKVLTILFFFLTITFFLLTVGTLHPNNTCIQMGGWFGIATAIVAWYGSAAVVINNTWNRTVLPVGVYLKDESIISSWTHWGKHAKTVG